MVQVLTRALTRYMREGRPLDKSAQRALHWHLANLEFACAAPLTTVSAKDWDQDDVNEYDGDHYILPEGGCACTTRSHAPAPRDTTLPQQPQHEQQQ